MFKKRLSFTLFLSLMVLATVFGQPTVYAATSSASPSIEWQQNYYPGATSNLKAVTQTKDGGYALAGMGMCIVVGGIAPWLVKVDSSGNKQWDKAYFDDKLNVYLGGADSIVQTSDNGYVIVGGSYLYKIDSEGNLQWRKSYGNVSELSFSKSNDEGFVLGGSSGGDGWLASVNLNGDLLWTHTYGGEKIIKGFSTVLVQTRDGGFVLASIVGTSGSGYTTWLIKTDSSGNLLWNRTYAGPAGDFELQCIIESTDGGLVLAGSSNNVFLIKTDSTGQIVWNQTYGVNEAALSIIQTSDNGYAIGCGWDSGNLIKTDSAGVLQWNLAFNASVYSVLQTSNGEYVVLGSDMSSGGWLAKTSANADSVENTPSPSPTPTAPEFSMLTIVVGAFIGASILAVFSLKEHIKTLKC